MSEIKLKRCPFCGGEAEMNYSVFFKYEAYARCKCCGARTMEFSSASLQDTRLKAIQSWNTRKPMQEIAKKLEKKIDNRLYDPNWNAGIIASISVVESVGGING